jgi:ribosome-binding factor A
MKKQRLIRINELLKREISELIFRLVNKSNIDMAAITITKVKTSADLHSAAVFVSIRGHKDERKNILRVLQQYAPEIQHEINNDIVLKYTPHLHFELDTAIEHGDHILKVLDSLNIPESNN